MDSVWYLDWQFWSAVVAVMAVILSQLPPVRLWLRGYRVICEAHERIQLTHKIGVPNIQWYLGFENKGGREVRIEKLCCRVTFPCGQVISIPAKTYQRSEGGQLTLLTSFKILPGQEWAYPVCFWEDLTRTDEREMRLLESRAQHDVEMARRSIGGEGPFSIATETHLAVNDYFNRKYKWAVGEYHVELRAHIRGKPKSLSSHRFTVFEHDERFFKEAVERYVIGDGVYYYSPINSWLNIPVSPA